MTHGPLLDRYDLWSSFFLLNLIIITLSFLLTFIVSRPHSTFLTLLDCGFVDAGTSCLLFGLHDRALYELSDVAKSHSRNLEISGIFLNFFHIIFWSIFSWFDRKFLEILKKNMQNSLQKEIFSMQFGNIRMLIRQRYSSLARQYSVWSLYEVVFMLFTLSWNQPFGCFEFFNHILLEKRSRVHQYSKLFI